MPSQQLNVGTVMQDVVTAYRVLMTEQELTEQASKAEIDRAVMELQDAFADGEHNIWARDNASTVTAFETFPEEDDPSTGPVSTEEDNWPGAQAWEAYLKELAKRDQVVKWELGDWLVKGEKHYPSLDPADIPGMT